MIICLDKFFVSVFQKIVQTLFWILVNDDFIWLTPYFNSYYSHTYIQRTVKLKTKPKLYDYHTFKEKEEEIDCVINYGNELILLSSSLRATGIGVL